MNKKIGIIFADSMEYAPFEKYALENGGKTGMLFNYNCVNCKKEKNGSSIEICAIECGIGKACAASACALLIAGFGADIVLNAGLSGAVSGCRREDIVVGVSYCECDMNLTAIGYKPGTKPDYPTEYEADNKLVSIAESCSLKKAKLGTGDIFLTDRDTKQYYLKTFSINAFDMETAAIASVCYKTGTPFMSIRKISDDADDAATDAYREMNNRAEESLTMVLDRFLDRAFEEYKA